jgi:hypothetical protein
MQEPSREWVPKADDYLPEGGCSSPIVELIPLIAASPFKIAPEREDDLRDILDAREIRMQIDPDRRLFNVCVNVETHHITLGLGAAERMWAYVYGYTSILKCTKEQVGRKQIDLVPHREAAAAMELMAWALSQDVQGQPLEWTDHLPKPVMGATGDSLAGTATNLFVCVVGWIVLHEIGHVECSHPPNIALLPGQRITHEYEADTWASDWALSNWEAHDANPLVFAKRSAAIVIALSIMASFEVYDRRAGDQTHPDPPDRLFKFVSGFVPKNAPHDWAWWVAITALKPHLDKMGIMGESSQGYDSVQDCLGDMLLKLKRHQT